MSNPRRTRTSELDIHYRVKSEVTLEQFIEMLKKSIDDELAYVKNPSNVRLFYDKGECDEYEDPNVETLHIKCEYEMSDYEVKVKKEFEERYRVQQLKLADSKDDRYKQYLELQKEFGATDDK